MRGAVNRALWTRDDPAFALGGRSMGARWALARWGRRPFSPHLTLNPALRTVTGMLPRLAAGALVALTLTLASRGGWADEPSKAAPASSVTPAPSPPQAQIHGAVVVAASEGAGPAAWALAFEVYRDPELRPAIDDDTARVLAGSPPAEGAPARLAELAELRASIARSWPTAAPPAADAGPAPSPGSDLIARRLLASLGSELGAALVVAVTMDGNRPVARALRPTATGFERIELGPTVDIAPDGARAFRWPGAAASLRGLISGAAPAPPAPPLAPKVEVAPPAPAEPRPFYKSPWFWGSVGGAAVVGLSVFLISRATSSSSDVHLTGKVGP